MTLKHTIDCENFEYGNNYIVKDSELVEEDKKNATYKATFIADDKEKAIDMLSRELGKKITIIEK